MLILSSCNQGGIQTIAPHIKEGTLRKLNFTLIIKTMHEKTIKGYENSFKLLFEFINKNSIEKNFMELYNKTFPILYIRPKNQTQFHTINCNPNIQKITRVLILAKQIDKTKPNSKTDKMIKLNKKIILLNTPYVPIKIKLFFPCEINISKLSAHRNIIPVYSIKTEIFPYNIIYFESLICNNISLDQLLHIIFYRPYIILIKNLTTKELYHQSFDISSKGKTYWSSYKRNPKTEDQLEKRFKQFSNIILFGKKAFNLLKQKANSNLYFTMNNDYYQYKSDDENSWVSKNKIKIKKPSEKKLHSKIINSFFDPFKIQQDNIFEYDHKKTSLNVYGNLCNIAKKNKIKLANHSNDKNPLINILKNLPLKDKQIYINDDLSIQ